MVAVTESHLTNRIAPFELEAQTGYPGAPADEQAQGGQTIRRLLGAFQRDPIFSQWARHPFIVSVMQQLFDSSVSLVQTHHNCIMTKSPAFSSDTGWHQDIRYWRYESPKLINAWLALEDENKEKGGLMVIPGSHKAQYHTSQFDERMFFRPDGVYNRQILLSTMDVELNKGDVLLFHSRVLHAASRNYTQDCKYSLVFTYKPQDLKPIPDTRSASLPQINLD